MAPPRIVIDTNVIVAAQRSRRGGSSKLLGLLGAGKYELCLSVALILEYEDVLLRHQTELGLSQNDVTDLIDSLCALGHAVQAHFQWRPFVRDPGDEFVLELAVAASCEYIVTFNTRNFVGAERFGIQVVTPRTLLIMLGEGK